MVEKKKQPQLKNSKDDDGALLQWGREMSVGNRVLDEDHKAFFDLAHIIMEVDADNHNSIVFQSALNMLADYVAGHFLREEKALRAASYPHFEEHLHKHHAFRKRIMKIVDDYSEGKNEDLRNLPGLVVNWLKQHILDEDMQYKAFIKAKFVDKRPLAFLAAEADDIGNLADQEC